MMIFRGFAEVSVLLNTKIVSYHAVDRTSVFLSMYIDITSK